MKLAIFSDLHLHTWPTFDRVEKNGLSGRLMDGYRAVREIIEKASAAGCKVLLFSGDWYHVKRVPAPAIQITAALLKYADSHGIKLHYIPGNHDTVDDKGTVSSVALLEPDALQLKGTVWSDAYGPMIAGIPYKRTSEELYETLKTMRSAIKPNVLLVHGPLDGAMMTGDVVTPAEADGLNPAKLLQMSGAQLVIAGHYHDPQVYVREWQSAQGLKDGEEVKGGLVLIPGAPMQHTFGDEGSRRGWWIYDDKAKTLGWNRLNNSPKFMSVSYSYVLQHPEAIVGKYVHLVIPSSVKASKAQRVAEAVNAVAAGFRCSVVEPERAEDPPRSDIKPSMEPLQALRTYARNNPPPDSDRTMRLAQRVFNLALEGTDRGA